MRGGGELELREGAEVERGSKSRRKCYHEKTRAKRVCLQNAHVRLWTPELETFGPTPESNRARTPTGHMHAV